MMAPNNLQTYLQRSLEESDLCETHKWYELRRRGLISDPAD
jgi:hypothetical protein